MGSKLLIAGYFGCGNLGDDAILLGFLKGIEGLRYDVNVLSGYPEETYRLYGTKATPRRENAAVTAAIQECDALVFAGGSIFQDVSSVGSVSYYAGLVSKAKKAGKKVVMLGQGVGPLNNFLGKRMAAGAFNQADLIVVRDQASSQTLRNLGVKVTPRVAGDLAYLLPKPSLAEDAMSFQVGNMKSIGIAPRPFGKNKETIQLFGELCKLVFQANLMPVLVEMDRELDGPMIVEIEKTQGGKVPSIRKAHTPMQLQQRIMRMDALIAMRLHAGILAATVDVPPYMLAYDPKVTAFAASANLPSPPGMQGMTPQRIMDGFMLFYKERDKIAAQLARRRDEMVKLSQQNIQYLTEVVKV
ncbi:MAG TPA: polysaccharide pyruvyl transferase family protein [Fimbriimonadaceae bacterium]|nr:polysaccharide pyruvyl transferase family protein [Fimbriimonadaceae bacterium]